MSFSERCGHTPLRLENKELFKISLTIPIVRNSYTLFLYFSTFREVILHLFIMGRETYTSLVNILQNLTSSVRQVETLSVVHLT